MVAIESSATTALTDPLDSLPGTSLPRTPDFIPKPSNAEILTQQDLYSVYSNLLQQEQGIANYIANKINELTSTGILSESLGKNLQYQFEKGSLTGLSALILVEKLGSSITDKTNLLSKITAEDLEYILTFSEQLTAQGVNSAAQNIEAALSAGGVAMVRKHQSDITSGKPLVSSQRLDTGTSTNFAGIDVAGALRTGLFTAPSDRNGGSSEFHIDTKFARNLSMEEKVALMDQIARGYQAEGRRVEFSNNGVSSEAYNPDDDYQKKAALLQRAFDAHKSKYPDWQSIDYYVPLASDSNGRFGDSVESVEMLAPKVSGANIITGIADGYGKFMELVDAAGNTILKTGHGDIAK